MAWPCRNAPGPVAAAAAARCIQYSHRNPAEAAHADQVIGALKQLIDRARAAGLKIYGGIPMPFEGSPDYTPEGEADRQAMNAFIRSGAFDGVLISMRRCAIPAILPVCAPISRPMGIYTPMTRVTG
jgi:hypothetical protein